MRETIRQPVKLEPFLEALGKIHVLRIQCFHGIGAFEVYRLKVSALKPHPSVCSVLRRFGFFRNESREEREQVRVFD